MGRPREIERKIKVRNSPREEDGYKEMRIGDAIPDLVKRGLDPEGAARECGIHERTMYLWITAARAAELAIEMGQEPPEGDLVYLQFLRDLEEAKPRLVNTLELRVAELAPNLDAKDAGDLLGRLKKKKWSRVDKVEVTHTVAVEQYAGAMQQFAMKLMQELQLSPEQQLRAPDAVRVALASVVNQTENVMGQAIEGSAAPRELTA